MAIFTAIVVTVIGGLLVAFFAQLVHYIGEKRITLAYIAETAHVFGPSETPLKQIEYVMQFRGLLQKVQKAYYKKYLLPRTLSFLSWTDIDSSLIVADDWIPNKPLQMNDLHLAWGASPQVIPLDPSLLDQLRDELQRAIENNPIYRLLKFSHTDDAFDLTFGLGTYDEFIATCEALNWETARDLLRFSKHLFGNKFAPGEFDDRLIARFCKQARAEKRRRIDILDFTNRSASIGINVLTVMKYHRKSLFIVHDRSKRGVSEAINTIHVVPAGTFQPVVAGDLAHDTEFDLLHTACREFAEELFAGGEPHRGTTYTSMAQFYTDFPVQDAANKMFHDPEVGKSFHFLGLGIDPLNLKPEFMLLLVIDMDRAEERYSLRFKPNVEGYFNMHDFTVDELQKLAKNSKALAVAQAMFLLACRHKTIIDDMLAKL